MNISPLSQRSSSKGIPETLEEVVLRSEESNVALLRNESEVDRLSHSDEILNPIKVPIHFYEGSGYGGSFPSTSDQQLWPGPRGGAFIWLSCSGSSEAQQGGILRSKQKVKIHRLEIQIHAEQDDQTVALYSCREAELQRSNPTLGFFKTLFRDPRKAIIHPVSTISGLEAQKRTDLGLMADFSFGALGGRDPRPIIWNNVKGKATEFDPKSLKCRGEEDLLRGGASAISREPIFDETNGTFLMIQRTDGIGSDIRYSQFRLIVLIPGWPRIATFMAPRSLSLTLLSVSDDWILCSAVFHDRRLFYVVSKKEGRLMAVYQSCVNGMKKFVNLCEGRTGLEMVALMGDGSLRRYLFPRIQIEVARFDGAAGLLNNFPVAEFETVCDGPFDQVAHSVKSGHFARIGSTLLRINSKFVIEQVRQLTPQRLSDFVLFPLSRDGQMCICALGMDPYSGRISMNIVDGGDDMNIVAKISLGSQSGPIEEMSLVSPIYVPTKINK